MGRVEFSFRKQVSIEQGRKLKFLQPYSSGSNVTLHTTVEPKFGQNDLTPVLQRCIARAVAQLSLRQGLAIELASIPRLDNRPRFAFASRHFSRSPAAHFFQPFLGARESTHYKAIISGAFFALYYSVSLFRALPI